MALTGSAAFGSSTSLINVGSDASLDDIPQGTTLAWVKRTATVTDARIWQKAYTGAHSAFTAFVAYEIGNKPAFLIDRAATDLYINGGTTLPIGVWSFVAAQWDINGANPDQKLFQGTLNSPAAEVSSYTTQLAGGGVRASDAAAPLTIGNRQNGSVQLGGDMALLVITPALLSLDEIRDVQYRMTMPRGCVGYWRPGQQGLSVSLDESGHGNHGALTAVALSAETVYPYPESSRAARWKRALFAPAAGFNAAWARGSNAVYQPGVC